MTSMGRILELRGAAEVLSNAKYEVLASAGCNGIGPCPSCDASDILHDALMEVRIELNHAKAEEV